MKKHFLLFASLFFMLAVSIMSAQNRVEFNNQQLFLNGANFAWINFAQDIGPGNTNFTQFENIFKDVGANGGNAMRLWLHTTGGTTPQFNDTGLVIGPGTGAIEDLKQILDIAWKYHVGVIPCLWSFDMMRTSNGAAITNRSRKMLEDTTHLRAYIDNALIPMVAALKGHPAVIAWEIFNEPEGMTPVANWDFTQHVPISSVQRFINLTAGAIHRTDTAAQVSNGSWAFIASSNVTASFRKQTALTAQEKKEIEDRFEQKYGARLSAEKILAPFQAAVNFNYYSDSQLTASGGDPDGTLDFYMVHYYDWGGTAISPFHHPKSFWNLDKPVVIGEFALNNNFPGITKDSLYDVLFMGGYAGSLAWSWTDVGLSSRADMLASMLRIKTKFPTAVTINIPTGTILSFAASPATIENGDSTKLKWSASPGSVVTLNGNTVGSADSLFVSPDTTTSYKLIASGEITDSAEITVTVLLSGNIVSFTANPPVIGPGEPSTLQWHTVSGSAVTLNGVSVNSTDSLIVNPLADSTFKLIAAGAVSDTSSLTVTVLSATSVNRALNRPATASSGELDSPVADPHFAVDGNTSSRWSSAWSNNQWIAVDLGQTFDIQRVILRWETAYGQVYRIEISNDQQNWTQIYFTSSSDGGVDDITGLSGVARYVRMFGLSKATEWGFSLWEFEVYGVPAVLDVEDRSSRLPSEFRLRQNYPNPFNPTTTIQYDVAAAGDVTVELFDLLGRTIKVLTNEYHQPGYYTLAINGNELASGIYLISLKTSSFYQTRKISLVK